MQVEAQRLCDIQHQTYATEQDLNDAFTKAMDDSGISAKDQKTLREQREDDEKLRTEIDAKYKAVCS